MGHGTPLTFKLARCAHGERNLIDNFEEAQLQAECKRAGEVLLPGVDFATAYAMGQTQPKGTLGVERLTHIGATGATGQDPEQWQVAIDTGYAERGWAVRMPQAWAGLHHVVRYFDLIESGNKETGGEAPDTPLLEWLVSAGVVTGAIALKTMKRFTMKASTIGRHAFVLDPNDAARLKMAAEVRQQLEVEERLARNA